MMRSPYRPGDRVAVYDQTAERWVSAQVIASKMGRVIIATATWRGVVPPLPQWIRPIYLVSAA